MHHLLKEDIFKEQCLYCGNSLQLDQFKTEHILHELLYKVAICECGKEASVKITHNNKKDCSWIEKEVMGDERVKHLI
ncbi:hypothetical protein HZA96_04565 [Candidatus Woesearchaeota archaeon]|nr:hypothetical protein [Candidatus Woesearchaeota archaeon]